MNIPASSAALKRYLRHGTLPQLVTLEAVMRLGSASQAAEALCMAPSTLSGHLQRLGDALQVTLFEARGRQSVPTPAAVALLETSHEIFAALERCELRLDDCRAAQPAPGMPHHREVLAASHRDDRLHRSGRASMHRPAGAGSGDRPALR